MPEGYILERGLRVGPDDAGQTTNLLANDGIPLVRHGGTALLLAFSKGFLGLANFRPLQMSYFKGDFLAQSRHQGESRDKGGVAVARDYLAGDGRRLEIELGADPLFVFRVKVSQGADSAGELAESEVFGGALEAQKRSASFVPPKRKLQTKRNRLGMDSVGPADGDSVLEFLSAAMQNLQQTKDTLSQKCR